MSAVERLLRIGPFALALIGCVLLIVAEFTTLTAIKIITVERGSITGGEHHLYALLVIGLGAAFMAWGATVGRSQPAAWALLALAVAALAIVLIADLPRVNEEGLIGRTYEAARAEPRIGFYLESLGAVVLLLAAVARLVLGPVSPRPTPAGLQDPPAASEPA